jgi:hypothetical protein
MSNDLARRLGFAEAMSSLTPITSVSTADTAFVDVFDRGPIDVPVRVANYSEFEQVFGGCSHLSAASYGVRAFFENGGRTAWIVRVLPSDAERASLAAPGLLRLEAVTAGGWGNRLRIAVLHGEENRFTLAVGEEVVTATRPFVRPLEIFDDLTLSDGPRAAGRVVNGVSAYLRIVITPGATGRPPESAGFVSSSQDPAHYMSLGGGTDGSLPGTASWEEIEGGSALLGDETQGTGLYAVDRAGPARVNILCLPATTSLSRSAATAVITGATRFCAARQILYLVDPPPPDELGRWEVKDLVGFIEGLRHPNAAMFVARLVVPDPLNGSRPRAIAPSGAAAGVLARRDEAAGVWKPAMGAEGVVQGAALEREMSRGELFDLTGTGMNSMRSVASIGPSLEGDRTLIETVPGAGRWSHLPVRRTALFLEASIRQGLRWVSSETNGPALWSRIREQVNEFLTMLHEHGAFAGPHPAGAFVVRCDALTTTKADLAAGFVNLFVGFAPEEPSEFDFIQVRLPARA